MLSILLCEGLRPEMVSRIPTGLHRIAGKPLFLYPLDSIQSLEESGAIYVVAPIVSSAPENIYDYVPSQATFLEQRQQESSINAILRIIDAVPDERVLIVEGERPLLTASSIREVLEHHIEEECNGTIALTRTDVSEPFSNNDPSTWPSSANTAGHASGGVYVFQTQLLKRLLGNMNVRGALGGIDGALVSLYSSDTACKVYLRQNECIWVKNRIDLASATALMRRRINRSHMKNGVQFDDPEHTYIDSEVSIGAQTTIHAGCSIEGKTRIGASCVIGPNAIIKDSTIGDRSIVEAAAIEASSIGPGSRIRVGIHLVSNIRVNVS